MKIKSPQNIELYDIQVDDRSVRYRSIMNDDSLSLYFSLPGIVSVPLGSYVDFEGQRYTLFYPENFKKHNTRNFEYTLVLHGNRELLKRFKFKDTAAIPYRLKFPLTAKPVDFVTRIVQNMNLHDSGWTVGTCIDATEKLISFNHESCFVVLGRLAQEFNTEWEIAGKTIHLRKVEKFKADPLALSYGKGNGFKSGTGRMNDGDKIPIGRLYVQGGERNIDFASYGSASLLLPKSATLVYEGKTYRTDAEGMSITRDGNTNIGEESYDGSDIYPKWTGIVSEVIAVDASKNLYDIKDSSIPLALNYRDCRIPGEKATIVFQSGILAGREFDIEQTEDELTGYIHAERRFKIVPQEQDGMVMPGGTFIPAVGDKYAVFNIRMPQAYISVDATKKGASWDLFREAVKYFAENETQKFQFTGELDGVWSKSRWLQIGGKIVPGGHVLFSDPQFLPGGEVIRIISVKDYVNSPHKPEITLSNAPVSGSFSSGLAKLEAEEVVIEQNRKDMIRFAQRQWRDTKETQAMLEQSLLNFSGSINPVTIKTMQLIAGDESLQFRFVNSKTTPVRVDHDITFNLSTKVLTAAAGIIQHMTLGITEMSTKNRVNTYKFWDISGYTSPPLTFAEKAFYCYLKCSKTGTTGTYLLSETAIGMESVSGFYHFLIGILNSEQSGDRSFAPVYGFTEILPGRITTDKIISQDGNTFFDLVNGIIGGKISFTAGSSGLANLSEWAAAAQDIQDAQATANQAIIDAENARQEAFDNVTDYNAKFATLQQQVDGEVNNWFYAYTPTPSNYPASDWTTNAIRDRHIGDTFTNTQAYVSASATPDAGKSWRYVKSAGTYSWTPIADSDAVKALLEAATAQSTADGKSTTYLTQPVKYSAGDTWVLAANTTINSIAYKAGDILTATQSSATYNAAHWSKKVRYTDDTAANAVNTKIADILNDNIADPSDKQYLKQRWGEIEKEYFVIGNEAEELGVTSYGNYEVAYLNLGATLQPLFTDMTANSVVSGSGIRSKFAEYYKWKATVEKEMSLKRVAPFTYLAEKLLQAAVTGLPSSINGGLILTSLIAVRNAMGDIKGGFLGLDNVNLSLWGGSTLEQALQNIAGYLFNKDGSGHLAGGRLWWNTLGKLFIGDKTLSQAIEISTGTIPTLSAIQNKEIKTFDEVYLTASKDLNNPADSPFEIRLSHVEEFELEHDAIINLNCEIVSNKIGNPSGYGWDGSIEFTNITTNTVIETKFAAAEVTYYELSNAHFPKGKYKITLRMACGAYPSGPNQHIGAEISFSGSFQHKVKKVVIGLDGIAIFDTTSDNLMRMSLDSNLLEAVGNVHIQSSDKTKAFAIDNSGIKYRLSSGGIWKSLT